MRTKTYSLGCIPVLFWLFFITGEVLSVVKFFTSDFEPSYKREMVYGFSTITGLGIIVGWFDIPDTKPQTK